MIASVLFVFGLMVTMVHGATWPLDGNKNPVSGAITTFWIDPQNLWYNRELINQGRKELRSALRRVIRFAEAALKDGTTYTVTRKADNMLPPSGDKHDFYSLARFYWPDATKPDGLPYARRDGELNPEAYDLPDATYLQVVIDDVFNLALAYFFTGNEAYAAHGAKRVRDMFLNPATKMNPNLNYANWIKGTDNGVVTGEQQIFSPGASTEMNKIYMLIDGINLLKNSQSFSSNDYNGMVDWFTEYLNWLQSSPRGYLDFSSPNNIGTWYDVQITALTFFIGRTDLASKQQQTTLQRLTQQMSADGSQPLELARASSWYFSNYNLEAYFVQIGFSQTTGLSVFNYETTDGKSVKKALEFMISFGLKSGAGWPAINRAAFDIKKLSQMCKQAFVVTKDTKYLESANQMQGGRAFIWNVNRLWAPHGAYDSLPNASMPSSSPLSAYVIMAAVSTLMMAGFF